MLWENNLTYLTKYGSLQLRYDTSILKAVYQVNLYLAVPHDLSFSNSSCLHLLLECWKEGRCSFYAGFLTLEPHITGINHENKRLCLLRRSARKTSAQNSLSLPQKSVERTQSYTYKQEAVIDQWGESWTKCWPCRCITGHFGDQVIHIPRTLFSGLYSW